MGRTLSSKHKKRARDLARAYSTNPDKAKYRGHKVAEERSKKALFKNSNRMR